MTGTPGIGKSVFGTYLLQLSRCIALARHYCFVFRNAELLVVFSDGGVEGEDYSSFKCAGHLHDRSSWYLSDSTKVPEEILSLATVLLVSPRYKRTKELFLEATRFRAGFHTSVGLGRAAGMHVSELFSLMCQIRPW